MNENITEVLKDTKARKGAFSFFVLLIMFCVNVPIILKEAFSKTIQMIDISTIIGIWVEVEEIKIPLYQYTLLSMFIESMLVIHGSELILALIEIGKKIAYKLFSIPNQEKEG